MLRTGRHSSAQVPGVQPCSLRGARRPAVPSQPRLAPPRHQLAPLQSTETFEQAPALTVEDLPVGDMISDVPGAQPVEDALGTPFDDKKRGEAGRPISELTVGQKVTGTVVNVTDFGVFVTFGYERNGLLHISQAADGFIQPGQLTAMYEPGQEVELYVVRVDMEKQNVSLGRKARAPREGGPARVAKRPQANKKPLSDFQAGQEVTGKVVNVRDFGAFVDIGAVKDALVHKSQLSVTFVEVPADFLKSGQEVTGRILEVDLIREKIALSLKGYGSDTELDGAAAPPKPRSGGRARGLQAASREGRDNGRFDF